MTDYLEIQEDEDALDLWEAARRLDDVLARLTAGDAEVRQMEAADAQNEETDEKTLQSGDEDSVGGGGAAALPLLEEASRGRTSAEGGLTGYGRGRDASSKGPWTERAGPAVGSAAFERENTRMEDDIQAERLDRIFRRDSRRYDGGFFLY